MELSSLIMLCAEQVQYEEPQENHTVFALIFHNPSALDLGIFGYMM